MKTPVFPTSQDAEQAFYAAFQKSDLDAMMGVWAEDEEVYCVHPGGPRLSGIDKVRESWRRIFAGGLTMRFELREAQALRGRLLAVHSAYEIITVVGEARQAQPVIATNIYMNTDRGWRMIVHHASGVTGARVAEPTHGVLH